MELNENTVDYLKARVQALEKHNQMLRDELNELIKTLTSFCESINQR